MSHTYCCALFHCVFSTKDRRKSIPAETQTRLWAYIGGIAREHGMTALAVGGTNDHVHMLLSLPSSMPVAKAMREIKAASSRWMHETCNLQNFHWTIADTSHPGLHRQPTRTPQETRFSG
jgi:REP element-mobilizing transposase RayT